MPDSENVRPTGPQAPAPVNVADDALGYGSDDEQEMTPEEGYVETEETPEDWSALEQQPQDQQPQDQQPQDQQKIFGKYETLQQAEEGYRHLTALLGRQSQELGEMRQLNANLLKMLQQVAAQHQQQQPQVPPVDPAKLWEQLAENPQETISNLVTPLVEQRIARERALLGQAMQNMMASIQPALQQVQMQQVSGQIENSFREQAQQLHRQYSDFPKYVPEMRKRIQANPQLLFIPGAFETLYKAVKQDVDQQAPARSAKAAVRLPQTGARVINNKSANDALVEEALGPISGKGEWD